MQFPLQRSGGRRLWSLLLLTFMMLGFATDSFGQLNATYRFAAGVGAPTDMTGSTNLPSSSPDDGASAVVPIGFNFIFNTVTYTQFSVNSNGLLKLGGTAISGTRFNESFPGTDPPAADYPVLAPYWDDLYLRGTLIRYKLTGAAPFQVLTVEWQFEKFSGDNSENMSMQVRMYETTNKIEFWYGAYTILTATPGLLNAFIGIASSGGGTPNFMGVVIGPPAGVYTSGNTILTTYPATNTMYTFDCYNVSIAGHPGEGGTFSMNNGEQILTNALQDVNASKIYRPFTVASSGCATANFTFSITGPNAADYQIAPTSVQVPGGQSATPALTFRPSAGGLRSATLTITDGVGFTRSYPLRGRGSSIRFVGNIPQGGLADMSDGAELMKTIKVRPGLSGNFTPLTVENIDANLSNPAVTVSYSITGLSGGQYSIAPPSTALNPSTSATPVITFTPTGIGTIVDELVVSTSEGIVRKFKLMAIADIPAVVFQMNGTTIDSTSTLFTNVQGCVGAEVVSIPFDAVNVGIGAVTITNIKEYLTDTVYTNGTPRYPLRLDAHGQPVTISDYFITDQPVTASFNNRLPLAAPIQVPQGETKRLYLNFISAQPRKRFSRIYIYTDGASYGNIDVDGTFRRGLLRVDAFGRGTGSKFSGSATGGLPPAILFPVTGVGGSSEVTIPLHNTGTCDLRISLPKLQLTSGDVDEFFISRMPNGYVEPGTGDLVLGPGESSEIVLGFRPLQMGSRRAGLRLATNDSTIQIPGITERGVYYVDMFGGGLADLYADGAQFGQSLIDGGASEYLHGVVRMRNTTNSSLTLTSIVLDNTTDFSEDPARPWPVTPYVIEAGEELELGVVFHPKGGNPGERTGTLTFTTNSLETSASVTGIAGTRMLEVNPLAINFPNTTFGKFQRRMVRIKNIGTMPVRVEQPQVTGADAENFRVSKLERTLLSPGQSELVELTFQPVGSILVVSGELMVGGNATNAPLAVLLNASSMPNGSGGDDTSIPVTGRDIENGVGRSDENLNVSGVDAESAASGMLLRQSMPNPARDIVEISYVLAKAGDVELALYDGSGRLVQVMDSGVRAAGERSIRLDVSSLAAGMYHYRLTANGQSLSRMMHITK